MDADDEDDDEEVVEEEEEEEDPLLEPGLEPAESSMSR